MKKHLINLKNRLPEKQNFMVFKILGAMLLVFAINFSSVTAGEGLLSERIQLRVDNVTLKDALKEIEKQSEFTFLYNDASINVNQTISVSAAELSIKDLLDEVLDDKGINYTIIDNQIVLTKAIKFQEDKVTVSGKVTDSESGEGLPGVTVVEKGTSNGTITDLDGNYTLSVSAEASLLISYVGYVTEEILVAGQTTIDLGLIPDIISLEDVVVIGYGTVKKSDLTGAVASVSSEELNQSAVIGVDQALQGRTAGVSVTSNSGTPGGATQVMIRGMGTITDPNPLFVVDGMPMSAADVGVLNPGDIESTEILKDASAAAIYGTRAANGVVMITTKKGSADKSSITYDMYEGVQVVGKKIDLLSGDQYLALRDTMGIASEVAETNTDWQDEIFRKAAIRKHQLTFLGGSENLQYAVMGSYYKQEGIVKNTDYERYTFRVNTSANIKPWLTVGENISFVHSTQNRVLEQNEWVSVIIAALTNDPAIPVYLPDSVRADIANPYSHYTGATRSNTINPVGAIDRTHNVTKTNKLLGNVFADLKPVKWLTLRTSLGAEITKLQNEQFFPEYYETDPISRPVNNLVKGNFDTDHLVWENTITFNKTFAEKHSLTVLGGYTRENTKYRMLVYNGADVPTDPELWYISNAAGEVNVQDITGGTFEGLSVDPAAPYDNALVSYIGRIIYSYDNLVDFTGSIRRDGSSRFTGADKWAIFPSFAAGLKISEFDFFQNVGVINFFKVRFGWGKLGNQNIPDYAAYTSIDPDMDYTFGLYGNQIAYIGGAPTSIGNKNLFWEETEMTNIGLDINFLENKIALNADIYQRKTKDMLAAVPIPIVVGVANAPYVNTGEVENKGIELNLIYKDKYGDFSYTVSGNIGFMKNEVTKLPVDIRSGSFLDTQWAANTSEGQPIASFYGYVTDGYWQNDEEIQAANDRAIAAGHNYFDTQRTSPGDVKFVDINNDSVINDLDRTFIGSPHPKFTYGISIDLKYKFVDLKIFGQGVSGNDLFYGPMIYHESSVGDYNMSTTMLDYWQKEGDNTAVPRLDRRNENNNMRFSDRYICDGSYFRIKNLQLGFTLPQEWTRTALIENCRIYFAAQNLLTISSYRGFDPEIGRGNDNLETGDSGILDIGIDRGFYPLAKSYMIGLTLTF